MSFDNDELSELSGASFGPEPTELIAQFTSTFDPSRLALLDPEQVVAALGPRVEQHHKHIQLWRDWLNRFEAALDERSRTE